jgi:superfamily II DNA or RNA helicase
MRNMPRFNLREDQGDTPESPEALFRDLRPRDRAVRDLYLRQGDVLRAYHALEPQPPDVALELPTGAGKTLVGLLIAEYRRRALDQRVAYLCPTVQLARQAGAKARGYGIEAVVLVRQQREWDPAEFARFQRRRAIAISTYSAVFNSNPVVDPCEP